MNEFVNPQNRGVNLPEGFKDLIDVLGAKESLPDSGVGKTKVERCANGLDHVERFLNRLLNSKFKRSVLMFLLRRGHSVALMHFSSGIRMDVHFGAGDLMLERTLKETFAGMGIISVSHDYSPEKGRNGYCFQVPRDRSQLLEIIIKVLGAYGISGTDELTFLLRA